MNNFQFVRIKDFLHYFLIKPNNKGRGVKDPFILDFINNVLLAHESEWLKKIENFRNELIDNTTKIEIEDFGAGSRNNKSKYRKISKIAGNASSTSRKCKLLFNLVSYYKPVTIIELGTSLGIGTYSLSLANKEATVYTLEGSLELFNRANENFKKQNITNIRSILGKFDDKFLMLIEQLGSVDLFFIDGNHTYEATLRYFNMALKYSPNSTILVFDDIRWSEGMYSAWLDICGNPEAKMVIDLLDIGIVFISNEIISRQYFRIYY
jgi:predicted O-methyltransferase YrrM